MKKLLNLNGAQRLSKNELTNINGGGSGNCWQACPATCTCNVFTGYKCDCTP